MWKELTLFITVNTMSLSMVLYNINSNIQINNIIRSNYYIAYEYYMHVISIN